LPEGVMEDRKTVLESFFIKPKLKTENKHPFKTPGDSTEQASLSFSQGGIGLNLDVLL
jgi:hypothetical protein